MTETKGMTYIRMMLDVLTKKEIHLRKILEFTLEQETLLKAEVLDEVEFTELVEKKDGIIRKIEEFDQRLRKKISKDYLKLKSPIKIFHQSIENYYLRLGK